MERKNIFKKLVGGGILCALIFGFGVFSAYMGYRYLHRLKFTNPPVAVQLDSTNLPIVNIEVLNNINRISRDDYVKVRVSIINNVSGLNFIDTITNPNQTLDYTGTAKMRYRGGGSLVLEKKSYALRLTDDNGEDKKAAILGMKKSKKWCLLAVHRDGSMMRDILTYELSRPYFDYVPNAKYCELIINGNYQGVYLLSEEVSRDRLGIKKLKGGEGDMLRGYLLEKDQDLTFHSKYPSRDRNGNDISSEGVSIEIKYPKVRDLSDEQKQIIQNEFNQMEDAIESGRYANYSQYIDVESFVNFFIVQELANNVDGYNRSVKLYKSSKDTRFKLAPWDFDVAYGNWMEFEGRYTDVWHYEDESEFLNYSQNAVFWWQRLIQDSIFKEMVKVKWGVLRKGDFSNESINAVIDSLYYSLTVNDAIGRNSRAWRTWINKRQNAWSGKSFNDEVDYLRAWFMARLNYLDEQLLGIPLDDKQQEQTKQVGEITMFKSRKSNN